MNLDQFDQLTKETSHCTRGALTDNFGWIFQIILASLAFACLIGKEIFIELFFVKF